LIGRIAKVDDGTSKRERAECMKKTRHYVSYGRGNQKDEDVMNGLAVDPSFHLLVSQVKVPDSRMTLHVGVTPTCPHLGEVIFSRWTGPDRFLTPKWIRDRNMNI
jgi:hypothetical protein